MDIIRSSRTISLITLISRITGLARDMLIAWWLGNSWIQDRLSYAFTIPNLFRRLFGEGALSAVFIPVFTKKLARDEKEAAWRLLNNITTLLVIALATITALLILIILIFWLLSDRTNQSTLTALLTGIMLPYMIFVCLVGLYSGVLNCFGKFALPAFLPIILNIAQIIAVIIANTLLAKIGIPKEKQVYIVAVAVLTAGSIQLALIMRACKRLGIKLQLILEPKSHEVISIIKLMIPMIVGLGIMQFTAWLDNQIILSFTETSNAKSFSFLGHNIHYPLKEGALSAVNFARRLYNLPLGVLGISLATAAFPLLSRHHAENNHIAFREDLTRAFNLAIFQGLPTGVLLIVLAESIVRVLFERGAFTEYHTQETALVLKFYSLGLWAYFGQHIILRGFYSLNDTYTPLKVMAITVIFGIIINITLMWLPSLRQGVFGLSTSIMITINVFILGYILSKRIGKLNLKLTAICLAKTSTATVSMAASVIASKILLEQISKQTNLTVLMNKYVELFFLLLVSASVFTTVAFLLKTEELKLLIKIRR